MIDITNSNPSDMTVENPFVRDYERRLEEYKMQVEDYQAKLRNAEEEKQLHGLKVALTTTAAATAVFAIAGAAKDRKYKKAVNKAWQSGYDVGSGLTEMSANSYIAGLNDGLKALPGNKT